MILAPLDQTSALSNYPSSIAFLAPRTLPYMPRTIGIPGIKVASVSTRSLLPGNQTVHQKARWDPYSH
jgi:hypothetical protein